MVTMFVRFMLARCGCGHNLPARLPSRLTTFLLFACIILPIVLGKTGICSEDSSMPNVVFILSDDHRWDCLSIAGHPYLQTPHMDRIAKEGVRFANMFVTTSICSPSRVSILSGLYAHAHGVTNNHTDYPENLRTFPLQLQAAGYATAYIGKWHVNDNSDDPRPGFDYWASHKGQGVYHDAPFNINGERKILEGYYTERVTDLAVDWIKDQSRDRPFMLMLGHKVPHTPPTPQPQFALFDDVQISYPASVFNLDNKPDWITRRLPTWHGIHGPLWGLRDNFPDSTPEGVDAFAAFVRSYYAMVLSLDNSVGRILAVLEDTGQLDNTLLIYSSDNGFLLGAHGMMDKRAAHEESIRVPLLVRYPRLIQPGTVVDRMVLNVDIAPSILDISGVEPLPNIHGRSWKPLLTDDINVDWRTSWFYEYNYEKQFPFTPNVRAVRTDEWKYIHYPHGDGSPDRHMAELYHLRDDPLEMNNLINDSRYADKVAELRAELTRLMRKIGALPDRMPLDEGF